jgi:RIO kinase 1
MHDENKTENQTRADLGEERPLDFTPSFSGGRQEAAWISSALSDFYDDLWLNDIAFRVKGGKEATVYCCDAHHSTERELLAAKVFRPTMFRAMRNDALYRVGRETLDHESKSVRDTRRKRALEKRTAFGRSLATASWCQHEYRALAELHAAGADVPEPLACGDNAILMEFIGDRHGAAPVLHDVRLPRSEARRLFERLIENVRLLLGSYRIHGDLSAYNVLYWDGEVRLIDFPQAIDAINHPMAFELLTRDLDRLCRYFTKHGVAVASDANGLAHDLWSEIM